MHNLSGISISLLPNVWVKVRGNRSEKISQLRDMNLKKSILRRCTIIFSLYEKML